MTLDLTPLTINDRPRLERVVALTQPGGRTPLASWAFPTQFIWRELFSYAWTELDGWWCLFAEYEDGIFMPLPPLGPCAWVGSASPGPLKDVLVQVMDFMKTRNGDSGVTRIENIPEEQKDELQQLGYRLVSKDADYLYQTEDLVNLKGDRYKAPRAAYNRFLRAHRVRYAPYRVPDRDACLALLQRWIAQKEETPITGGRSVRHCGSLYVEGCSLRTPDGIVSLRSPWSHWAGSLGQWDDTRIHVRIRTVIGCILCIVRGDRSSHLWIGAVPF